ncbi:MAG: phenylalanine--tRNA ligase subunit beta [Bacilli bacterium]|nr:phenylalanine--tRNA ligase subunit beta [Bacilli bacterium]
MRISLNWLKQYVDIDEYSPEKLAEKITIAGVEVEEIIHMASGSNLIIGFVEERIDHPDSDHLSVCKVNIGNEIIQIVCGAPNVDKNQKVIVALPGANLPAKGVIIKKGNIRNQESNGMICSLLELGVDEKYLSQEQKDGIEILGNDAPIGDKNPLAYLGLDDVIFELKPTPNRGDVLSMISFIYEVSAVLDKPIKKSLESISFNKLTKSSYLVSSETKKCQRFAVRGISNIKVKESPNWLIQVLRSCGIRSINNIVDIGNYIMILLGQPLHMYDANKLSDNKIIVKEGISGEFIALDDIKYNLDKDDLLVTSSNQLCCLAGIMGSKSTEIDNNTKNIVIESAEFSGVQLRKTSRRLQLFSEASNRFIRGIDYTRSLYALDLAAKMLEKYADAKIIEEIVTYGNYDFIPTKITLSAKKVNDVLGTNFSTFAIASVFDRLKFKFNEFDGVFVVEIPSYRNDILIEEDLIEEIIRILGFENLQETNPKISTFGGYSSIQHKRKIIRDYLVSNGIYEALSYTLESKKSIGDFCVLNENKNCEVINVLSPMTEDRMYLRQSLIPSLLRSVNYNNFRKINDIKLFEISKMYYSNLEHEHLAIAISGNINNTKWQKGKVVDFYTVKGLVTGILELLGIDANRYSFIRIENDNMYYHPGRSAYLVCGKKIFGVVGEVHPLMNNKYDIKDTIVCELDLDYIFSLKNSITKFEAPSMYPSISRDIALLVKSDVMSIELIKSIKKIGKKIVRSAEVFDIYEGQNLESGYKSIAINIVYQDKERTLKEDEVLEIHNKIIKDLEDAFNAKLRS